MAIKFLDNEEKQTSSSLRFIDEEESQVTPVDQNETFSQKAQAGLSQGMDILKGAASRIDPTSYESITGGIGQEFGQEVKREVLDMVMPGNDAITSSFKEAVVQGTYGGNVLGSAGVMKNLLRSQRKLALAERAKTSLDELRSTLGQAKSLAIQEVKDVPTALETKGMTQKIVNAIQNPIYEVEFNPDGSLKQTVGNLDKVKEAVSELIHTPKVWEEAPNKELRMVKQFRGVVNNEMRRAAAKSGKPVDRALNAYSNFMENYYNVNKTLVDTAGNLQANKMRNAFRVTAEPAIKQAWKDVAKSSPEIKKVMNNMNMRETISNLLKLGGVTYVGSEVFKRATD